MEEEVEYSTWEFIYSRFKELWPSEEDYLAYAWIYILREPRFTCETEGLDDRLRAAKAEYEDGVRAKFPTLAAITAERDRLDQESIEKLMTWIAEGDKKD